jgi:hypothetical protein
MVELSNPKSPRIVPERFRQGEAAKIRGGFVSGRFRAISDRLKRWSFGVERVFKTVFGVREVVRG